MISASLPLDARRHAMLKAMGVDLWWQPAPPMEGQKQASGKTASATAEEKREAVSDGGQRVSLQVSPNLQQGRTQPVPDQDKSQSIERAVTAQRVATPAATEQAETAASTANRIEPSRKVAAVTPVVVSDKPAVFWSAPSAWNASAATSEAETKNTSPIKWLLAVDDVHVLGDEAQAARTLLENMVKAMRLSDSPNVWSSWVRREAHDQQEALAAASQALTTLTPSIVLVMGRDAAHSLLDSSAPLGVLRQQAHRVQDTPVIVTYSPAYLLRAAHAKAGAWADLQRAMAIAMRLEQGEKLP